MPESNDRTDNLPNRAGPGAAGASHCARVYGVVFAAALALYLLSVAPGPLWQDSGLAQLRVLRGDFHGELGLALSHPLYYLLATAFQWLPLAESALKTNLVSVVFGAVTIANVFLLVRLATGGTIGASVAALTLAVAHTFWQHCALAEVYTVTTALMTLELLCLFQYARTGRARWWIALYFANGLGVSNHMVAVLSLACYGAATIWLVSQRRVHVAVAVRCALAWTLGAAPYLGLIVGEIIGGAGLGATIHSALFGKAYASAVTNLIPDARMLTNSVLYLGLNFPTPAALLVLPGLLAMRSWRPRLPAVVLTALFAIHLVWAVRYDVPDQYTFFIPAVVLLAVLIGFGAGRFLQSRSRRWKAAVVAAALLPPAVYVPLPALARKAGLRLDTGRPVPYRDTYDYFLRPWKTGYDGAARFAREVHDTLPSGSVVVVAADATTARPLHYFQLTGRWTRNVRLLPSAREPRPTTMVTPADVRRELEAGHVYVVSPVRGYCPQWLLDGYELVPDGVLFRASATKTRWPP